MIGTRIPGIDFDHSSAPPGSYGLWKAGGGWYAVTPNGHPANLTGHQVAEHEDGTITVTPSIGVGTSRVQVYHGFLERGVWRDA